MGSNHAQFQQKKKKKKRKEKRRKDMPANYTASTPPPLHPYCNDHAVIVS